MTTASWAWALLAAILIVFGAYLTFGPKSGFSSLPAQTGGGLGAHCGGFIKNAPTCAAGFHCQLVVSRPDTGGTCVKD